MTSSQAQGVVGGHAVFEEAIGGPRDASDHVGVGLRLADGGVDDRIEDTEAEITRASIRASVTVPRSGSTARTRVVVATRTVTVRDLSHGERT